MAADRQIQCDGCGEAVPASDIQLDAEGSSLCRKCHALGVSRAADQTQQQQGARRRCHRCDTMTLLRGEPFAPLRLYGYGPGVEASVPWAVAYPFRCSSCGLRTVLVSLGGFLILFLLVGIIAAASYSNAGEWTAAAVAGSILLIVVARDVAVRLRHPTR